MKKWFLALNTQTKLYLITVLIIFVVINIYAVKLAWYKYQYLKQLEKEVTELKAQIKKHDDAETKIIEDAKGVTVGVKKKSKNIDQKLKEDEKAIDNSNITNGELQDFLTRHGED
jgi:predicted Holliday junction resolvase-like endonuclease